eukprot:15453594-Alexandrium_andersonii.AAC.1
MPPPYPQGADLPSARIRIQQPVPEARQLRESRPRAGARRVHLCVWAASNQFPSCVPRGHSSKESIPSSHAGAPHNLLWAFCPVLCRKV